MHTAAASPTLRVRAAAAACGHAQLLTHSQTRRFICDLKGGCQGREGGGMMSKDQQRSHTSALSASTPCAALLNRAAILQERSRTQWRIIHRRVTNVITRNAAFNQPADCVPCHYPVCMRHTHNISLIQPSVRVVAVKCHTHHTHASYTRITHTASDTTTSTQTPHQPNAHTP